MGKSIVYLVGAGPGSADLITLRGLRAIAASDVVVMDSLLPDDFLEQLGINMANKRLYRLVENGRRMSQDEINTLVLEHALAGKKVARVKTGDPHIFGRGLEEEQFLSERGVPWEYIPGISVFSAGTGLSDMPLTRRSEARSFAVATGRLAGGDVNEKLPYADTLCWFMSVEVFADLAERLIDSGFAPDTPVFIIERGCMPFQRNFFATLSTAPAVSEKEGLRSPAIFVVGEAARKQPINGRKRILFTGLDPANFRSMGELINWPVIEIEKTSERARLSEVFAQLKSGFFRYVVITSKVSARLLLDAVRASNHDMRLFRGTAVIVAGLGTAQVVSEYGIRADIIPDDIGSAGILSQTEGLDGGNVLIVQSATAPEAMANRISRSLGAVTHLRLHRVVPKAAMPERLPEFDVVYFTCPSGVRAFHERYGEAGFRGEIWSIGDVTRKQIRKFGFDSEVVLPYVS
ncbi:MAG: uroporphyrinogen-III C-methyltransferase [Phycisphaerae bacterium]